MININIIFIIHKIINNHIYQIMIIYMQILKIKILINKKIHILNIASPK